MAEIVVPRVGMGCTENVGSDSYPYTITGLEFTKKGACKAFYMTRDVATRTDQGGYYTEDQRYEYRSNPDAPPIRVTLRSDGKWKVAGDTQVISLGYRLRYNDPSY